MPNPPQIAELEVARASAKLGQDAVSAAIPVDANVGYDLPFSTL